MIALQFLIVILFCSFNSFAFEFDTQGQMSLIGASMPQQKLEEIAKDTAALELTYKANLEFSKNWKLKAQPWIYYNNLALDTEEKNQIEIDEFTFEYKKSSQKIKLGFSTLNWEGTDFLNPMDFFNSKNWRDPLNSRSRSSAGLFYSNQWNKISVDFAFIPKKSLSLFPGQKSAWLPRNISIPTESEELLLLLPNKVEYLLEKEEIVNRALDNNFALRTQYHGDNWDFSLAGAETSASPPFLFPTISVSPIQVFPKKIYQLTNPIQIKPVYYKQRVFASAATATFSSWILRIAASHTESLSQDSRLTAWSDFGVLGVEKSLQWKTQTLALIFQFATTRKPVSENMSLVSSLLERAYMLGWRWQLSEKLIWTQALFQEQKFKSSLSHSELSFSINDQWALLIASDILSGSDETVLGLYDANDRFTFKTTYSF